MRLYDQDKQQVKHVGCKEEAYEQRLCLWSFLSAAIFLFTLKVIETFRKPIEMLKKVISIR